MVKLGQLMASSPGLFPRVVSDEMRRLLDAVPAEPADRVRRHRARARAADRGAVRRLRRSPARRRVDRPGAPGHAARRHRGGREGAPAAPAAPHRAGPAASCGCSPSPLSPAGAIGESVNPVALVEDLAATLRAELDFRLEAEAMAEFERQPPRHGAPRRRRRAPTRSTAWCAERVLVMTYVARHAGRRRRRAARRRLRPRGDRAVGRAGVDRRARSCTASSTATCTPATSWSRPRARSRSSTSASPAGSTSARARVLRRALPAVLIDGDFGAVVRGIFAPRRRHQARRHRAATDDVARRARARSPSRRSATSATARC